MLQVPAGGSAAGQGQPRGRQHHKHPLPVHVADRARGPDRRCRGRRRGESFERADLSSFHTAHCLLPQHSTHLGSLDF